MSVYSSFFKDYIKDATGTTFYKGSFSYNNKNQGSETIINHNEDTDGDRIIQVYTLASGTGGLINTDLDFDLVDETQFVQEDVINGTDFESGVVKLHINGGNYTTTPSYITTSDQNQIDLSLISEINSCTITNSQPAGTSIKGLVSFDGRSTWSKWNGSSWIDSGITDLSAQNICDIQIAKKYKLVLNSDDAVNNSTSFTDSSMFNRTITNNGSPKHVTTANLDTSSAIYLNGSSYLSSPFSSELSTGTGDFTVAFYANIQATISDGVPFRVFTIGSQASSKYMTIGLGKNTGGLSGKSGLVVTTNFGSWSDYGSDDMGTINTGVWVHYAIVRSGNFLYFYKNGVPTGSVAFSTNINPTVGLTIGRNNHTSPGEFFNGYLNDLIFVNEALWTSGFTPPTSLTRKTLGAGNTIAEIQTGLTNLTKTSETYLDFAFDLSTVDTTATPSLDQITLNYDEVGVYRLANFTDFDIDYLTSTTTKVTSNLVGSNSFKVKILV